MLSIVRRLIGKEMEKDWKDWPWSYGGSEYPGRDWNRELPE
jgi:hypothetical protein